LESPPASSTISSSAAFVFLEPRVAFSFTALFVALPCGDAATTAVFFAGVDFFLFGMCNATAETRRSTSADLNV